MALLIGVAGTRFGYGLGDTILASPLNVLTGPYGSDSWRLMDVAWKYWNEGGRNVSLYSNLLIRDHIKFQYPPHTLLLTKFISDFQVKPDFFVSVATRLFLAVSLVAVYLILLRSYNTFNNPGKPGWDNVPSFILVALLSIFFYPFIEAANLGQIQFWINALFAIALLCTMMGWSVASGILIGLMASIKPQYGLFFIWGLLRNDKKFTLAVLSTAGLVILAGLLEFGSAPYFDYLKALSFMSQRGESFMANQSINGLLNRIFSIFDPVEYNNINWRARHFPPFNPVVYYGTLLGSILILMAALYGRKPKNHYALYVDFCLMALAVTMASPIAWSHHYGILLPIFALLGPFFWFNDQKLGSRNIFAWLLIGFYLVSGNLIYFLRVLAPTYLNFMQSYIFFGALGIFILLLYTRRKAQAFP